MPQEFKDAVFKPLVKNSSLNHDNLQLITDLFLTFLFIQNVKTAANQVCEHLKINNLFEEFSQILEPKALKIPW